MVVMGLVNGNEQIEQGVGLSLTVSDCIILTLIIHLFQQEKPIMIVWW
jgi:hypothetical protein